MVVVLLLVSPAAKVPAEPPGSSVSFPLVGAMLAATRPSEPVPTFRYGTTHSAPGLPPS